MNKQTIQAMLVAGVTGVIGDVVTYALLHRHVYVNGYNEGYDDGYDDGCEAFEEDEFEDEFENDKKAGEGNDEN